ncbi:MAG: alanine racemase [Ilumatobacteraceae bacterium]
MTLRLTVDRAAWEHHVEGTAAAYGHGLVPVVKGNGYGIGRRTLHELVRSAGAPMVCVGTVHELHDVPSALTPVVLTPTLAAPSTRRPILTVGALAHVDALRGWGGSVVVKLRSSMHRYGTAPADLQALVTAARTAGLTVEGYAVHLPLEGDDAARLDEVHGWLPHLEPGMPVWTSHLLPESFRSLRDAHPDRSWYVRVGTRLWHGVPRGSFLHVTTDVLQVTPMRAGEVAGYRHATVPFDGWLVAVGAGSSHGVVPLDDADPTRRSPFHFARRRLQLLEGPHMHTSLVVVPDGEPCPAVGDAVDVQRPLTTVTVDEVHWA